jgi:hypothetical protein
MEGRESWRYGLPNDDKKKIGYFRGDGWKELEKCFLMVPE